MARQRVAALALALIALVALVAAGPTTAKKKRPAEGPPRAGLTVFVSSNCANSAFQPPVIIVACGDATTFLEHLLWQNWTEAGAQATGILSYKNCPTEVPSVACQIYDSPPATVSLFRPRFCRKVKKNHFTRVYISATTAKEPSLRSFTVQSPCKFVRK